MGEPIYMTGFSFSTMKVTGLSGDVRERYYIPHFYRCGRFKYNVCRLLSLALGWTGLVSTFRYRLDYAQHLIAVRHD